MDNRLQPIPPDADPATAAFARLTEEVGVVRRLVAANDNSATLGEIVQRLDRMVDAINTLARRPAMKLTPDQMADQIAAAGEKARAEDSAAIKQARERMEKGARELESLIGKTATIREQRRGLAWMGGGGFIAGILLWSFLPGTVAREAPASWHWPERMAARTVGADRWVVGQRMMASANPARWQQIVAGRCVAAPSP
jgi:glutathione S-transferase